MSHANLHGRTVRRTFSAARTTVSTVVLLASLVCASTAHAGTTPELQLQMTTPSSLDTGTFGANGAEAIGVSFALLNAAQLPDLAAHAPFTVRTVLPAGVTYAGMNASTAAWSCTSTPPVVECTYSADLTYWNWASGGLAIWIDTAHGLPVPGSSPIRLTLESAEVPLPSPLVCEDVPSFNVATSDTGCVERTLQHRRSELQIVQSSWSHWTPEYTAGGTGQLGVGFRSLGYSQNNGQVTVDVLLPPGITRYGGGSSPPFACVDGVPGAQGTVVRCTTAYMYDGQEEHTAYLNFFVDIAEDVAIPGPLPVYATIHNALQPARAFPLCDDVPLPFGCGYYNGIVTRAAPQPQLDFTDVTHAPASLVAGQEATLRPGFANFGDGNAGPTTLQVAMPPGFAYDRLGNASPVATCSAAGAPQSGQTVTCQFVQGLPPGGTGYGGYAALIFTVLPGAALDSTAVLTIGDTLRPAPSLESCAANAAQIGCEQHLLPVSPWIFCDGFEALPHVCGSVQPFD